MINQNNKILNFFVKTKIYYYQRMIFFRSPKSVSTNTAIRSRVPHYKLNHNFCSVFQHYAVKRNNVYTFTDEYLQKSLCLLKLVYYQNLTVHFFWRGGGEEGTGVIRILIFIRLTRIFIKYDAIVIISKISASGLVCTVSYILN